MRLRTKLGALSIALCAASPGFAQEAKPAFPEYGKGINGIISPTLAWNETWNEVLGDIVVIGVIFAAIAAYLLYKYRATSPNAVGSATKLNFDKALAWALVPAALFMADDFMLSAKGWSLWNIQRTVPANALEVTVTASQWSFEFDYGNGVKDDTLVVPVGQPVVLRLVSTDVIHSFGLVDYRLKEDLVPGRINHMWFYPDKPLETFVTCMEFCGDGHSRMNATVKAVPKADFDAWLASHKKKASLSTPDTYAFAAAAPSL
ncbi:MAG: cytochrome c oxidase subunit II [Roseiarcus sp.]